MIHYDTLINNIWRSTVNMGTGSNYAVIMLKACQFTKVDTDFLRIGASVSSAKCGDHCLVWV